MLSAAVNNGDLFKVYTSIFYWVNFYWCIFKYTHTYVYASEIDDANMKSFIDTPVVLMLSWYKLDYNG